MQVMDLLTRLICRNVIIGRLVTGTIFRPRFQEERVVGVWGQIIDHPCKLIFNERRLMLKTIYNTNKDMTFYHILSHFIVAQKHTSNHRLPKCQQQNIEPLMNKP